MSESTAPQGPKIETAQERGETPRGPDSAAPQQRKVEGVAQLDESLDTLFARSGRRLRIFDRHLGAAYNRPHRTELLRGFLLASRSNRLQLVLHETSNLQRDCPRLLDLLRRFSHSMSIHETEPQAKAVYDPFAVLDERDYVHRFHYDDARGLLGLDDPQEALNFVHRFDEIWEASTPAVSATTLGL
jgi:hypothetical protein